jgi:hypothetical protein
MSSLLNSYDSKAFILSKSITHQLSKRPAHMGKR